MIFIGPTDLAVSLGFEADSERHKVNAVIDEVIAASLSAGHQVGIFATTTETALYWMGKGCRFVLLASDLIFLTTAAAAAVTELQGAMRG